MALILPITLTGDNLGRRHKEINTLVIQAYDGNEDFKGIQNIPEKSPIDRLFKIDLASKHRDVNYIIQNLRDSDMLYVSRALKSKWLLEPKYQNIINPEYLEENVYPDMCTTAITKMKHWVHLNMQDENRLEEFYKFYSEKEFGLAIKFLVKSSKEFIKNEFLKIVHKVSPRYFKLLCEKNPQIAKMFFDLLAHDETHKSWYLNNENNFYKGIKCLLKSDTNLYLDITEKYFHFYQFSRLSSIATRFIMYHHKERFWSKPELYTAWILDVATIAENLNVEEIKYLVEKLAKATYLKVWFGYKNVEPLIKRLKPEERAAFKKKVFIENDVGDKVEEWPYEPPIKLQIEYFGPDIFVDRRHEPYEYERLSHLNFRKKLKKRKYCAWQFCDTRKDEVGCHRVKTLLEKLFDEFRFVGFERTFYELRKRIMAESSPQNRQFIMLVLISKTGGRADAIATLMELLARHSNEPPHLRAAIIRSLVKRAFIWRLPQETWKKLLEFGQGLGLDGSPPEADCVEGLHSVFIRCLLRNDNCDAAIFNAFLGKFSVLCNYELTSAEKKCVSEVFPKILLTAANEKVKVQVAVDLINKLIEVLKAYHIKVETYPGLIPTVVDLAEKDYSACTYLLENLYKAKVGRKELFRFTYKIIKTDVSQINALKHDITVLDFGIFYESCLKYNKFKQFFRKLAIYFFEDSGLAMYYRNKLKEKEHNKLFSGPLATLLGDTLESYLITLDKDKKVESKVFAATIRANAHRARPSLDIDTFGWHKAGVKMISNKLITCPLVDVENNVQKLLKWKQTARLALVLSKRSKNETDVFVTLAKLRPTIGIKLGIKILREQGDNFDLEVWDTISPLIENIDFHQNTKTIYVQKIITKIENIPMKLRPEYTETIFKTFAKIESFDRYALMPYLCRIEHLLPNIKADFIENILYKFFENDFVLEKLSINDDVDILCNCMFVRILFTYILLSESREVEKSRFETFGHKLLDCLSDLFKLPNSKETFFVYLDEILLSLKYTKVFLSSEYVSCLPVMEKIVSWMRTILPIDQYIDRYITIHLTMLYYKAVRQTVKQAPEVFENEKRRNKEGVKIVANLFGKYIAKEVKELRAKYFESIIYLYRDTLITYLDNYFTSVQTCDFLSSMIKGILEEDRGEVRLGMFLFKNKYNSMSKDVSAEISKSIEEVSDFKNKFFVGAELFS